MEDFQAEEMQISSDWNLDQSPQIFAATGLQSYFQRIRKIDQEYEGRTRVRLHSVCVSCPLIQVPPGLLHPLPWLQLLRNQMLQKLLLQSPLGHCLHFPPLLLRIQTPFPLCKAQTLICITRWVFSSSRYRIWAWSVYAQPRDQCREGSINSTRKWTDIAGLSIPVRGHPLITPSY